MHINTITSYSKGIHAEKLACQYFISLGFTILAQRFKTKYGEIDLIASTEQLIVFCEIKYRNTINMNIIQSKQKKRIIDTCTIWLTNDNIQYQEHRFDVLFFDKHNNHYHIPHAWTLNDT